MSIEINKCKVHPIGVWGEVYGDINDQKDLIELVNAGEADVKEYVDGKIAEVEAEIPSLEGLASEEYVNTKVEQVREEIPSLEGYATENFVEGKIAEVEAEIPSLEGYATEEYVEGKIAEVEAEIPSLEGYATEEYVDDEIGRVEAQIPSLDGYATEEWVEDKIDEVEEEIPSLEGYATESWVEAKNYLTEHQHLKTINEESIIGDGNIEISGGLDPEQLEILQPELNPEGGILYTKEITYPGFLKAGINTNNSCCGIGEANGDIYVFFFNTLYKYENNFTFTSLGDFTGSIPTSPIWSDNSGRIYFGTYIIDFENHQIVDGNLNAWAYNSDAGHHSIFIGQYGIYNYLDDGYQVFNEETQQFGEEIYYPDGHNVESYNFMSNAIKYGDRTIAFFNNNSTCYELIETEDGIDFITVENPLGVTPPSGWYGNSIYWDNDAWWQLDNNSLYKLEDDTWNQVEMDGDFSDFKPIEQRLFKKYIFATCQSSGFNIMIINLSGENDKVTSWVNTTNIGAVDLKSDQIIGGNKTFNGHVDAYNISLSTVEGYVTFNGKVFLGDVEVRNSLKVDGDYAVKHNELIVNETRADVGTECEPAGTGGDFYITQPDNYFVTSSGRFFIQTGSSGVKEFDGNSWVTVNIDFPDVIQTYYRHVQFVRTANGDYASINGEIYRWNNTNTTWIDTGCEAYDGYMFSIGPAFCMGRGSKNTNYYQFDYHNNEWVEKPSLSVMNSNSVESVDVNGTLYLLDKVGNLYTYSYSDDTLDLCTSFDISVGEYQNFTTYNGKMYVWDRYVNEIFKISADGTSEKQNIYKGLGGSYYGGFMPYEGHGIITHGWPTNFFMAYMYGIEYSKPTVPTVDGDYVLKCTVTDGNPVYSWVSE